MQSGYARDRFLLAAPEEKHFSEHAITPQLIELQLRTRDDLPLDSLRAPAESIARDCLHELSELPQMLLARASVESPAAWPGVLLF